MAKYLLFEEDGAFRAGTVLAATDAAYQVELASGKRTKVKTSHVLLAFDQPTPAELLRQANAAAEGIDIDFLWECAPQEEFEFSDLAREYFGHTPNAVEAASILFRLHAAPVYFHRKGRGRYRPAPPDVLKVALAALERKRRQEQLRQQYVDALKAGSVPEVIAQLGVRLLLRPDKNSIEYKAVEQAAGELQMTPLRLLLARGAIASPYRWHVDSFLATAFPRGTGFAADVPAPVLPEGLPLADVVAYSIDDSATTEIDDAFSLQRLSDRVRVGIHIAAPGVAIPRGHALDEVARTRMSTVYAPGLKITMLPEPWIDAFSLNEGKVVPVLSLYVDVDAQSYAILASRTAVERVRIAGNLRHDRLDEIVTEEAVAAGALPIEFGEELCFLWRWARALLGQREAVRGRPEPLGRIDYTFVIDGEGEHAHVTIRPRKRGAPLDLIVAELMILANSHWGGWLALLRRAAVYRSQRFERGASRVRMSTTPAPHEGIGVDHYAWSTSPLRRYVDLVNQRQLVAAARGEAAPYAANDAELFAIVSSFDAAYTAYADFQSRMERYWCLRWLQQENVRRIGATLIKGDVLRLDGLPLVTRLPGLPELPRGQRLELDVLGVDLVDLLLEARVHQLLAAQAPEEDLALDELPLEEPPEAPATSDAASSPPAV
ncbi:MAG: RNB domain-containing ribonuclease [Burkholderiaceae bacterium]